MRIGIDACCWSNRRGFGRFTRELVGALVARAPQHDFTVVLDSHTAEQARLPGAVRVVRVQTREQPTRAASAEGARSPLDLLALGRAVARLQLDVFFFPAVYSYFPLLRRVPSVVTFHDTIAEDHPALVFASARARSFWTLKCWLARRQARRVVTVSRSARTRLAARFRCPEPSIGLIPEAAGSEFGPVTDTLRLHQTRARYGVPSPVPLLLYVGGLSPHKNLQALLRAVARLTQLPWHVALVGDFRDDAFLGCHAELVALCSSLGLEQRVHFTGFVPNQDLVALYNSATLLVLPSLDEGFGLPALEAMACGLPVVASSRGSLPELLGSAGVLFDPLDEPALARVLAGLLADPEQRARLRDSGLARATQFSWTAAADAALGIFEGLGGHGCP